MKKKIKLAPKQLGGCCHEATGARDVWQNLSQRYQTNRQAHKLRPVSVGVSSTIAVGIGVGGAVALSGATVVPGGAKGAADAVGPPPPASAPAGAIVIEGAGVVAAAGAADGAGEAIAAEGAGVPAAPPASMSPQNRSTSKPERLGSGPW